jgi:hypothetical protein
LISSKAGSLEVQIFGAVMDAVGVGELTVVGVAPGAVEVQEAVVSASSAATTAVRAARGLICTLVSLWWAVRGAPA